MDLNESKKDITFVTCYNFLSKLFDVRCLDERSTSNMELFIDEIRKYSKVWNVFMIKTKKRSC